MTAAKRYRVVSGSMRDVDNSIKGVGDEVELSDEMAAQHGALVVLIDEVRAEAEVHQLARPVDRAGQNSASD